ncbi:ISAs1 family transposase [Succinivibrio dextrinosolvens]|nr:ISAs1 family transposase [Succinivibrio dextrinosolvens]
MTSTDQDAFDNTINDASFLQRIVELNLTDPRAQDRIIYPLSVICSIVILARICNCNDASEQRLFWLEKLPWLKESFYGLDDDVPSEQTLRRVVSILNTNETVNFLTNYFANHRELSEKPLGSVPLKEREVIAADGQNINATRSSKNGNDARKDSGIDIVSLHSSTYGITLSQRTVDKKNHEAEVILDMIKALNLRNAILTWDAINTRPYTVKAVVDANADFLVCLKDNQGNLIDDVKTGFQFYDMDKYPGESVSSTMVFEAHGRKEGKEIAILDAKYALSKEMRKSGLMSIL